MEPGPGALAVAAGVILAGAGVPELVGTAGESSIGKFERFNERLFEEALSDVLGVSAALQRCHFLQLSAR